MMRYLFLLLFIVCISASCGDDEQDSVPVEVEDEFDGDPDIGDITDPSIFYDKFEGPLNLEEWERVQQLWGQPSNPLHQHGGVIRENVSIQSGFLVLKALGDLYEGPLRGVQGHSKRLGGVAKSHRRFGSGRYEIKMRVLQVSDVGVLSAAWTFWYKELMEGQQTEAYNKAIAHGNIPDNGKIILNHEIDIEVKGHELSIRFLQIGSD